MEDQLWESHFSGHVDEPLAIDQIWQFHGSGILLKLFWVHDNPTKSTCYMLKSFKVTIRPMIFPINHLVL